MTVPPIFATMRFYKGATFSTDDIVLKNPDGTPQDITNWTGVMDIWREDADTDVDDPIFHLETGDGITITGVDGKIVAVIDADETDVLVDADGEQWPFRIVLTNPTPDPDYVERTVQGFVIAQK